MSAFLAAAFSVILITFLILLSLIDKNKSNVKIIALISTSALAVCILFPFCYIQISQYIPRGAFVFSILITISIVFILSIIIFTYAIKKDTQTSFDNKITESIKKILLKLDDTFSYFGKQIFNFVHENITKKFTQKTAFEKSNAIFFSNNNTEFSNELEFQDIQGKNILAKSVDSEQIIDTIGVNKREKEVEESDLWSFEEAVRKIEIPDEPDEAVDAEDASEETENAAVDAEDASEETENAAVDAEDASEEASAFAQAENKSEDTEIFLETQIVIDATKEEITESINICPDDSRHSSPLQNIDDNATIEELINKAYELKEKEDLEGAIQCYMQILEHKLDENVIFWCVVDICTLYKKLGQKDLAKMILDEYYKSFESIMDQSIKDEIEKQLND